LPTGIATADGGVLGTGAFADHGGCLKPSFSAWKIEKMNGELLLEKRAQGFFAGAY